MTEQRLAEIEARSKAATSGPWIVSDEAPSLVSGGEYIGEGEPDVAIDTDDSANPGADAAFIAHAREDVPALVDEVRRLRAALEALLDEQNGVPLLSRETQYRAAYADACACVGRDTQVVEP